MVFKWILKHQTLLILAILTILLLPTFWRMLKPGIFSMHDFHVFRLYEYDKCIADLQIPCRWAPDSAFEYGEPVFSFYAQLPYVFGEVFRFTGLSVLDSIKSLFIVSLVLSAISMFFLAKQFWGNNFSALISALVYTYAPYRAVDVWVRGALPEALAFIFFPVITYFFNEYVLKRRLRSLLLFGLSFAGLILTHNLSVLMYLIFFSLWAAYFFTKYKVWNLIPKFLVAGILAFGLTSFYILPVIFESSLVTLTETTGGYYNFKHHYTTLNQLLFSRYWGYGASLWGEDDRLSFAVGQVQWILPLVVGLYILIKKKIRNFLSFFALLFLGWFMLFLTHNKSTWIWDLIKPLSFVQFPWRFLGSAVFIFAFASGALMIIVKKSIRLIVLATVAAILISWNTPFFFEDLWYSWEDKDFFMGKNYEMQVGSAIHDFWPKTAGDVPTSFAPKDPLVIEGSGSGKLSEKRSNRASYALQIDSEVAKVQFPIVYFPGWVAVSNGNLMYAYPSGEYGLITVNAKAVDQQIELQFKDTLIRQVANMVSLLSVVLFVALYLILRYKKS